MASAGLVVVGLLMAFFGLGAAWNANEVARKDEQYDAIGSTRDAVEVEPAPWKVKLTRVTWAAVGLAGIGAVVVGLFL